MNGKVELKTVEHGCAQTEIRANLHVERVRRFDGLSVLFQLYPAGRRPVDQS